MTKKKKIILAIIAIILIGILSIIISKIIKSNKVKSEYNAANKIINQINNDAYVADMTVQNKALTNNLQTLQNDSKEILNYANQLGVILKNNSGFDTAQIQKINQFINLGNFEASSLKENYLVSKLVQDGYALSDMVLDNLSSGNLISNSSILKVEQDIQNLNNFNNEDLIDKYNTGKIEHGDVLLFVDPLEQSEQTYLSAANETVSTATKYQSTVSDDF